MSSNKRMSRVTQLVSLALVLSSDALAQKSPETLAQKSPEGLAQKSPATDPHEESFMRFDDKTLQRWTESEKRTQLDIDQYYLEDLVDKGALADVEIGAGALVQGGEAAQQISIEGAAQKQNHVDLSTSVQSPARRDQNRCSNCFVWAGTAAMEIALSSHLQLSTSEPLSIQYYNSCHTISSITDSACCTGFVREFVDWYEKKPMFVIPSSNTNASFADGDIACDELLEHPGQVPTDVGCNEISTTEKQYHIQSIELNAIETGAYEPDVDRQTAAARIRSVLQKDKGVIVSLGFRGSDQFKDFVDWWRNADENDPWDVDKYCDKDEPAGVRQGGKISRNNLRTGHVMLIVGYNYDFDHPYNSYWIVLNSFGVTARRPHGTLRMNMFMNYKCKMEGIAGPPVRLFETMDIQFGNAPSGKDRLMSSSSASIDAD